MGRRASRALARVARAKATAIRSTVGARSAFGTATHIVSIWQHQFGKAERANGFAFAAIVFLHKAQSDGCNIHSQFGRHIAAIAILKQGAPVADSKNWQEEIALSGVCTSIVIQSAVAG